MFYSWLRKLRLHVLSQGDVRSRLSHVAEAIEDHDVFERRAKLLAQELSARAARKLPALRIPLRPPNFVSRSPSEWVQAWTQAVFQTLSCMGPAGIATIQEVVFGRDDSAQVIAVEHLMRLASQSADRERILNTIAARFDALRIDVKLVAIVAAAQVHPYTEAFHSAVLRELAAAEQDGNVVDQLTILQSIVTHMPEEVVQRQHWLHHLITDAQELLISRADWYLPLTKPPSDMTEELRAVLNGWNAAIILKVLAPGDIDASRLVSELASHRDQRVAAIFRRSALRPAETE